MRSRNLALNCVACGGGTHEPLYAISIDRLVKCTVCGLIRFESLPSEIQLDEIYQGDTYGDLAYFDFDEFKEKSNHYLQMRRMAKYIKPHLQPSDQVLEIGSGRGTFLRICRELEINVMGLEISASLAEKVSQSLGVQVKTGTVEDLSGSNASYRAVFSFDVIEHCPNPLDWLNRINRLTVPGGHLFLSTVSVDNLLCRIGDFFYKLGVLAPLKRLYPDFHLFYFNPRNLVQLVEAAGFEVLELEQENYDCRKASRNRLVQIGLRVIYLWHDLTRRKTNLYLVGRKKA
ncbi:MAG: class I SAM-dependent methyltransferase [Oligoflexia bacterium]|nr:class I SAM-dependent methyltransferase [Oligoflexia bacterium]